MDTEVDTANRRHDLLVYFRGSCLLFSSPTCVCAGDGAHFNRVGVNLRGLRISVCGLAAWISDIFQNQVNSVGSELPTSCRRLENVQTIIARPHFVGLRNLLIPASIDYVRGRRGSPNGENSTINTNI
eukprot:1119122-Amorphochlora_amoeboformis.AAC.1